jgi:hypothetical protein
MADYNVRDFGAVGDATTIDTSAIQAAIDACTSAGGGRVVIPAGGRFLSGTIELKNNVELYVERGALLEASGEESDFVHMHVDKPQMENVYPNINQSISFIVAYDAQNIAVTGAGIIDGGGKKYIITELQHIYRMRQMRPFTFFFIGGSGITFHDVTIRDGALWTVRLSGCEDVLIDGIRILNDLKLPNSDGIDLDQCRNVRISNCHIVAGDDCICLKACDNTGDFGPCENITVTGCTLVSTSTALMVGCEAHRPMRNVVFDSCTIQSSNRGLGIHMSHESDVENIIFSNIVIETRLFDTDWWGRAEPIYVCLAPWTATDTIGHVRHVRFSNILCKGENGVFVYASEAGHIHDVIFDNVRMEMNKWTKWEGGRQDIRPCVGEGLPTYPNSAFYLHNADGITLRDCQVAWGDNRPDYYHHALEAINVTHLKLENFDGEAAHPATYAAVWEH